MALKMERITPDNRLLAWVEDRLPVISFLAAHTSRYYAPKNFNVWYLFGALAGVALVNQLVTGIFLAMHFKPSAAEAFSSVEYIMRDVEWGWLIRYMHSTGASLFFVVVGIGAVASVLARVFGSGIDVNLIENWIGRVLLAIYFGFFAFTWVYTWFGIEMTRPVPDG